jgi:hypothetical protein
MYRLKLEFLNFDSNKLFNVFCDKLSKLDIAPSITGKVDYQVIEVDDNQIRFRIIHRGINKVIKKEILLVVFNFIKRNAFNTTIIKNQLKDKFRWDLPSGICALLLAANMIEEDLYVIL